MKPCPRTLLERDYTRKNELLHEQLRKEQLRKEVANQNTDEFTMLMELGNGMEKKT